MESPTHSVASGPVLTPAESAPEAGPRARIDIKWVPFAVVSLGLGVLLAIHAPGDATHSDGPPAGPLGISAQIAGYLYGQIGVAAWVLTVLFAGWSWRIKLCKPMASLPWFCLGVPLSVFAGTIAAAVLWPASTWPISGDLGGGIVGDVLYGAVVPTVSGITGLAAKGVGYLMTAVTLTAIHTALGGDFRHLRTAMEMARGIRRFRLPHPSAIFAPPPPKAEEEAPPVVEIVAEPAPKPQAAKPKPIPEGPPARQVVRAEIGVEYALPPLDLLASAEPSAQVQPIDQAAIDESSRRLESALADFGVKGEVVAVQPGPVVTLFEFEPARGTKTSQVTGLAEDVARSMSATSTRISAIAGTQVIGIEIPNEVREMVRMREVFEGDDSAQKGLALALGKDIGGVPVFADLAAMPHVLIAGTTGSGKSVGINTMIVSLLLRMTPSDCRFILIDPKMLELTAYSGIPHLLAPVVTDPLEATAALHWVVEEMDARYAAMSRLGARSISAYNKRVIKMAEEIEASQAAAEDEAAIEEPTDNPADETADEFSGEPVEDLIEAPPAAPAPMPQIVVVIDEVADLILVAGKEFETAVQRIAQKARAAGIHLVMATQRPSADVITGTIKANFPTRISFRVSSKLDSRTILGDGGAEALLGHGDMLYMENGGKMIRVHGAFVSDDEIEAIADFVRDQGEPNYVDAVKDGGSFGLKKVTPRRTVRAQAG